MLHVSSITEQEMDDEIESTSLTRQDLLDNTTDTARTLLNSHDDQVSLIMDGTCIRHQKSSNSAFKRHSYSEQKKTRLCEAFTVSTMN